jgi:hypothetical protein
MTVSADAVIAVVAGGAILVGGACALASQLPFVKSRPGLSRIVTGVGWAAGRLALIVPPGATVAQVEAAIAAEAAHVMANYSQSAKAAGVSTTQVQSMIAGELGKLLPPGHVAQPPAAPPALQTLGQSSLAPLAPAPVAPAGPVLPVLPGQPA